jgi:hypothetical protein
MWRHHVNTLPNVIKAYDSYQDLSFFNVTNARARRRSCRLIIFLTENLINNLCFELVFFVSESSELFDNSLSILTHIANVGCEILFDDISSTSPV